MRPVLALLISAAGLLAGCDMLGIENPEKIAAAREAEGKAVGGACRHAGRAIEDCYALNRRADKAAMFAGWREMNDYMRENKIDALAPQLTAGAAKPPADAASSPAAAPAKPTGKAREARIDVRPAES
jgi:hypothetical protein